MWRWPDDGRNGRKLVATNGIIKLYVRQKTYTFITVFQLYNTTGCPLRNKRKRQCWSIALLICIISCGLCSSQHSDSPSAGQSSVRMQADARQFFSIPIQTSTGTHPVLFHGGFPGVKQLGHDVDFLPPSSAEVKHEQSYTSAPPSLPVMTCYLYLTFLKRGISNVCLLHNAKK